MNFSEPLSFLQRLTEDIEYSDILDRGALCADSCEQLAYVAAFTVSSYATTTTRTLKPFNPLLGETYECDRMDDLGWKSFAEQVRWVQMSIVLDLGCMATFKLLHIVCCVGKPSPAMRGHAHTG